MKQIKSLTYKITDPTALKELKENLIDESCSSIKERTIVVMDPLIKNTMGTDASVCKGVDVGLNIKKWKCNVQTQHMAKN